MAYDEGLAERSRELLATRDGIGERRIFGSLGFFCGGNLAVAAGADGLIVRLGPDAQKATEERGVSPFKPGDAKPMTGWVIVETAAVEDDAKLAEWVEAGVEFAGTLPAK